MARLQLPIVQWNGGISNDEFVGGAGSFYNSSNVKIREKSKCFTLNNESTAEKALGSNVTYGDITTMYGSGSNLWVLTKNGYIFDNNGGLIYTKTGEASILNAIPFTITGGAGTTNLVIVGSTKLTRTLHPGNTPLAVDFATLSTPDASTNDLNYRPSVTFDAHLYVAIGNKIDKIDNLGAITNGALILAKDDTIVSLLNVGDQIIIFTKNKQYYWNGSDEFYGASIQWTNYNIQNAVSLQNIIYVIADDSVYNYVFRVNGYSREVVSIGDMAANGRLAFQSSTTNQIESSSNLVYIPANSQTGDARIFAVGNLIPGFPFSMNGEYSYTGGSVKALSYSGGNLYYGYNRTISATLNSCFRYIERIGYKTGGYIETSPIFCGKAGQEKTAVKVRSGYHLTHADTSIKVYYRIDDETNYTLLDTITGSAAVYGTSTKVLPVKFYKIQFKIELLTTTTSYTPEFEDLTLIFDTVENEQ